MQKKDAMRKFIELFMSLLFLSYALAEEKKKSPIKFATIVYKKHLQFATMTTHTRTHANINRRKKSGKAENSKNNQSLPLLFNLSTDD